MIPPALTVDSVWREQTKVIIKDAFITAGEVGLHSSFSNCSSAISINMTLPHPAHYLHRWQRGALGYHEGGCDSCQRDHGQTDTVRAGHRGVEGVDGVEHGTICS